MKLIYFDEAKNDPAYPRFHIGAVCIDETALSRIEAQIVAVATSIFGNSVLCRETELHAAELFHRKSHFKDFADFTQRIGWIADMIGILGQADVQLINITINCDLLSDRQDPHEIAFMFLCERANDLVKSQASLGMLIGDREGDRLAARFGQSLSGYRARGTSLAFGRDIQNLVDSVHFTHSHLSRFLQLADFHTWYMQFSTRNPDPENPRSKQLLDLIRAREINLFPSKYKIWPKEKAS